MDPLRELALPREIVDRDRTPGFVGRLGLCAELGEPIPQSLDRGVVREEDLEGTL